MLRQQTVEYLKPCLFSLSLSQKAGKDSMYTVKRHCERSLGDATSRYEQGADVAVAANA